jgi:hypothetical protein
MTDLNNVLTFLPTGGLTTNSLLQLLTLKVKVKVTLGLAAHRQSIGLGVRPLEIHDQRFLQLDYQLSVLLITS